MYADCRGLALTTENEAAAKHIDAAVTDYLDYRTTAFGHIRSALNRIPLSCWRCVFAVISS